MAAYNGLYRARATKLQGTTLTAYIPQVFGNTPILINDFVGDPPTPPTMGWVLFHGGSAEIPVWMGTTTAASNGDGGSGGTPVDVAYRHVQGTAASTWTIDHGLGFYPNVTVIDSGGSVAEGNIAYPMLTRVVLTFSAAFSGVAYLS